MGKKIATNPKAVDAREKKEVVKKVQQEKEKKAKEDSLWVETDKHILSKEDRKKQLEDKKNQEADRKKAAREALAREEEELKNTYSKTQATPKVTQAEIARRKQIEELAAKKREEQDKEKEREIEENINRIIALEKATHGDAYIDARSVDEAVGHMSGLVISPDKHPEKRLKVAYAAFEEKNLPIVRAENPGLKLSQLKELLWKQWQKSPENPLNQI